MEQDKDNKSIETYFMIESEAREGAVRSQNRALCAVRRVHTRLLMIIASTP